MLGGHQVPSVSPRSEAQRWGRGPPLHPTTDSWPQIASLLSLCCSPEGKMPLWCAARGAWTPRLPQVTSPALWAAVKSESHERAWHLGSSASVPRAGDTGRGGPEPQAEHGVFSKLTPGWCLQVRCRKWSGHQGGISALLRTQGQHHLHCPTCAQLKRARTPQPLGLTAMPPSCWPSKWTRTVEAQWLPPATRASSGCSQVPETTEQVTLSTGWSAPGSRGTLMVMGTWLRPPVHQVPGCSDQYPRWLS